MSFICTGCPYANLPNQPIRCERNGSKYLLVFQAPGNDEWSGTTISGNRIPIDSANSHSCAARMRNSFVRKGVSRNNYDIAEAVCCYPGKNQNDRDKKPSARSITSCINNMERLLQKGQYTRIVCFGNIAYKVVSQALSAIHGNVPICTKASHPSSGVSNNALDSSY